MNNCFIRGVRGKPREKSNRAPAALCGGSPVALLSIIFCFIFPYIEFVKIFSPFQLQSIFLRYSMGVQLKRFLNRRLKYWMEEKPL